MSAPMLVLAPAGVFALIVKGSIVGLVTMTLVILAIWWVELRNGRIW
ncbi:MAG: hypothetical protein VKI81_03955 [Synechococcaceae cyanobacterium]|nr:hypothetical protein [Synechococcaceae cyanobacterium]